MSRFGTWRNEFSAPLHTLQRELNRLLEEYWSGHPQSPGNPGESSETEAAAWSPAIDLLETSDAFQVLVDLPGVPSNAIELSVTGRILTLRGRKELEVTTSENSPHLHSCERATGAFFRQVNLPGEVDINSPQAEIKDGVLRIRLAKGESARPRTIPIQMP